MITIIIVIMCSRPGVREREHAGVVCVRTRTNRNPPPHAAHYTERTRTHTLTYSVHSTATRTTRALWKHMLLVEYQIQNVHVWLTNITIVTATFARPAECRRYTIYSESCSHGVPPPAERIRVTHCSHDTNASSHFHGASSSNAP